MASNAAFTFPTAVCPVAALDVQPDLVHFAELWQRTSGSVPWFGPVRSRREKRAAEKSLIADLDGLSALALEGFDDGPGWRSRARTMASGAVFDALELSAAEARLVLSDGFMDSTLVFFRRARNNFPNTPLADLSQALRNVWVMLFAQELLGREIELTDAVFGYSMLYPVTDNMLDDRRIGREEKEAVAGWFRLRLEGEGVVPRSPHECDLDRLVACIERGWSRNLYPSLYGSLLAIHAAQQRSLEQHGEGPVDLLALSFDKGGSSVLADGYLVAGRLTPEMARFFFGYGVFLQLLDDLQDLADDKENGDRTLFTEAAKLGSLDSLTCRLVNFMDSVLDTAPGALDHDLKGLVRRSCLRIVFHSVAQHSEAFSRYFRRQVERSSPWRLDFLSGMEQDMRRRGRLLQRGRPAAAWWSLLLSGPTPTKPCSSSLVGNDHGSFC